MTQEFECVQLVDSKRHPERPADEWSEWPEHYVMAAQAAADRKLAELPLGSKVVAWRSCCERSVALSGVPWVLVYIIEVEIGATE